MPLVGPANLAAAWRSTRPLSGVILEEERKSYRERPVGEARWLVEYGDLAIECDDEADAKKLVAALHNNGRRVTARSFGTSPPRSIENVDQIKTWLAE